MCNKMTSFKIVFKYVLLVSIFLLFRSTKSQSKYRHEPSFPQDLYPPKNGGSSETDTSNLPPPVITIPSLGSIQGKKVPVEVDNEDLPPVIQYLGIPYAKPPTGNRRWKKPESTTSWKNVGNGILNATTFKAVCPQTREGPLPSVLLPVWYRPNSDFMRRKTTLMDEDCLYLNIYVPAIFYARESKHPNFYSTLLPVMIYFHGHTFSEGSGNLYDGSVLASYGEVIVVTFNYRLGALGFMSTMNEQARGNYGLWDQRMLVLWVSKNIQYFGGDKQLITAFGSGSGAASIGLLMLSVHTEGNQQGNITGAYFQKAILQSGSALTPWSIVREPRQYARSLARHNSINCPSDLSEKMLECLRLKTWREIISVPVTPKQYDLAFGPVVDGGNMFLSDEPSKILDGGEFLDYAVIIGVSQGDGFGYVRNSLKAASSRSGFEDDNFSYFASKALYERKNFDVDIASFIDTFYSDSIPSTSYVREIVKFMYTDWIDEDDPSRLKKSLMDLYTDRQWVNPAIQKANVQVSYHHPTYFYMFNHHPGIDADRSWINSAHGEELPFVFGAPLLKKPYGLFPYNYTKTDSMISEAVMTYWINFVKKGDPMKGVKQHNSYVGKKPNSFKKIIWPRYSTDTRAYLEISAIPSIGNHYRAEKVAFWNTFLPRLAYGFIEKQTSPNEPATLAPTKYPKPKTMKYTVDPDLYDKWQGSIKSTAADESNTVGLQLIITLAVGFVLLLVNIIAFAVVSYQNEKDKYKIEKLQSELKICRKFKNSSSKNGDAKKERLSEEGVGLNMRTNQQPEIDNRKPEDTINRLNMKQNHASTLPLHENDFRSKKDAMSPQSDPSSRTLDYASPRAGFSGNEPTSSSHAYAKSSKDFDLLAAGLLSPEKNRSGPFVNSKQEDSIGEVGFLSPNIGTNCNESDINYWSRSEFGDDSGASGSSDPAEKSFSKYSNTLPFKKSSVYSPAIANNSDNTAEKRAPRCRSALGIFSRADNEFYEHDNGSSGIYSLHRNYAKENASLRKNTSRDDIQQYQTVSQLRYHGSVQNLPPNHNGDMLPYHRPFSVPRPCIKENKFQRPQSLVSPTSNQQNIFDGSRNGRQHVPTGTLSSVTTKL